jgi:DNA-binding winged helix-turn-helix (wHTH) protein
MVQGPAGSSHVEPIVMKVLLLLLDAAGDVLTRDELFGNAWGDVFVGDDSLNRAIGQVRKIAHEAAPGLFEIEAIPRTGYRLTGKLVEDLRETAPDSASLDKKMPRRLLLASGAAAAGSLGRADFGGRRNARPNSASKR